MLQLTISPMWWWARSIVCPDGNGHMWGWEISVIALHVSTAMTTNCMTGQVESLEYREWGYQKPKCPHEIQGLSRRLDAGRFGDRWSRSIIRQLLLEKGGRFNEEVATRAKGDRASG
jgi:hypothetical protein